ncbi:MAG TPA: septum formation inhibitor Maf, partial [Oceanospirillales bacterium]|nr:septum formation inhibitor Maf [Oceanospirillales bacterium]
NDFWDEAVNRNSGTDQPLDWAGSLKGEGLGTTLFSAREGGDMTALCGLPRIGVCELMRQAGLEPRALAEA